MDIPSTGPTSLRSNYTDETDEGVRDVIIEEDPETPEPGISRQDADARFRVLTSSEELSQAKLISVD